MGARFLCLPILWAALLLACHPRSPAATSAAPAPSASAPPTTTEPAPLDDTRTLGLDGSTAAYAQTLRSIDAIAEALGRIGGERATRCLANVIQTGAYDPDAVQSPDFVHEIRWEAMRFGILAAGPEGHPTIEAAMRAKGQPAAIVRNTAQWEAGRSLVERCGRDSGCLRDVLADPQAEWFAREAAATLLARSTPGNAETAERIAQALATVRNPDARVTMAWLAAHVMQGARCDRCTQPLHDHLAQDRSKGLPAEYQLSVLMARYSIAKLREPRAR